MMKPELETYSVKDYERKKKWKRFKDKIKYNTEKFIKSLNNTPYILQTRFRAFVDIYKIKDKSKSLINLMIVSFMSFYIFVKFTNISFTFTTYTSFIFIMTLIHIYVPWLFEIIKRK